MKPEKAATVISCCAVLYNLLKLWGDDMDDIDSEGVDEDFVQPIVQTPNHEASDRGNGRRRAIVAQHFTSGM